MIVDTVPSAPALQSSSADEGARRLLIPALLAVALVALLLSMTPSHVAYSIGGVGTVAVLARGRVVLVAIRVALACGVLVPLLLGGG